MFIGALSLDGAVEKVEGMLPALIAAKSLGFKRVHLPFDPLIPLDMLEGLECIVIVHIQDVLQHLSGQGLLPAHVHLDFLVPIPLLYMSTQTDPIIQKQNLRSNL
ncbi:magnesium chelatase domain-containing protein [Metabacillus idriensis]|uniref:magnesium chelatase domain-containing protein n=1 Tax=Metabacillus idriensis TaxID=324768 RepID=UPI00174BB18D